MVVIPNAAITGVLFIQERVGTEDASLRLESADFRIEKSAVFVKSVGVPERDERVRARFSAGRVDFFDVFARERAVPERDVAEFAVERAVSVGGSRADKERFAVKRVGCELRRRRNLLRELAVAIDANRRAVVSSDVMRPDVRLGNGRDGVSIAIRSAIFFDEHPHGVSVEIEREELLRRADSENSLRFARLRRLNPRGDAEFRERDRTLREFDGVGDAVMERNSALERRLRRGRVKR